MTREWSGATGAVRDLYDAKDWSATALGAPETWSATLRGAVDFVLGTKFPATLLWGPEFVLVYNEAYVPILGEKHPASLGEPARDVFPEAWDVIGEWMRSVRGGGEAVFLEDALVPLNRDGVLQDAYFTFCYSAIRSRDGTIEGVIDVVAETTTSVISSRRLAVLAELRRLLGSLEQPNQVIERALRLLRSDVDDFVSADITSEPLLADAEGAHDAHLQRLPLGPVAAGGASSVLVLRTAPGVATDERFQDFVRLVASAITVALARLAAQRAEREVSRIEREFSETMQRSLLPVPIEPEHVQVAVRYVAAAELAEVGGDWYDAFLAPDGALTLVIGDIAGHDRDAAAAMAQVRNLLRGLAWTGGPTPGALLARLDDAMHGLGMDVVASAIVAQVTPGDGDTQRVLLANAGHPPPVVVAPDGTARLLESTPDMLLGVPAGAREDRTVALEAGSALVLYTDGLVERRGAPLGDGLAWLAGVLQGRADHDAEQLCDVLLAELGDDLEDDVALLVLRVEPS